jgi:NTP pyrophosphatase (non-canonical NTP hydrolase)
MQQNEFHAVRPIETVTIEQLQGICHHRALDAGWWDEYFTNNPEFFKKHMVGAKIALIHSEVSEALEGYRKGTMDDHLPHRKTVEVEFADTIIRILDLAGLLELDLAGAIAEKLAYNAQRHDHTREARAAEGGKSF